MSTVTAEHDAVGRTWLRPRWRLTVAGLAVAVLAAGALVTTRVTSGSRSENAASAKAAATAPVQRTDVAETTPATGTVGFASPVTMVEPAGTVPHDVTEARQSVAQAQLSLSQAQAALDADTAQLHADQETLAAAQQRQVNDCHGDATAGSGACTSAAADVASAQKAGDADQQRLGSDRDKVATVQLAASDAQTALAAATVAATGYDPTSKYTALPAAGDVIEPGKSLWSVDGHPVPLLVGTVTPWRAFASGMARGADVATLNRALSVGESDAFTSATAAAVVRLQASYGLPVTGTLLLGSVVFQPSATRVTKVYALLGASVEGGKPVLDVTSTTPVVNIALPVGQTSRVKVGNQVTVNLPDGTVADGTITAVGTVATTTTPSNNGNTTPSATLNVTVALTKASPAGSLDQAPVTVNITNNSAHQVLAVPTTALLALADGGYAVEVVDPNRTHRLIGVTTGIFDDRSGMVEVSGAGLQPEQRVVVAA